MVPTHAEYTRSKDDGSVLINSLTYPDLTRTSDLLLKSNTTLDDIPRNFGANLTYSCGQARLFKVSF